MNIYYKLKKRFIKLPIWQRTVLSSLIGALGGSSFIGFFNKYALYFHALKQGFRVPVEGVEYLDLAITIVSFAIILTSIMGTVIIYKSLNYIADYFAKFLIRNDNKKRKNTKNFFLLLQILFAFIAIGSPFMKGIFEKIELTDIPFSIYFLLILLIAFFVVGIFTFKRKRKTRLYTSILVLLMVTTITVSLFNQSLYSKFLMKIQFGGEIPIKVEYRSGDNLKECSEGRLLLKSKQSIILRKKNCIEEIPIARVVKISFL